jgi:hypothetical protein
VPYFDGEVRCSELSLAPGEGLNGVTIGSECIKVFTSLSTGLLNFTSLMESTWFNLPSAYFLKGRLIFQYRSYQVSVYVLVVLHLPMS